MKLAIVGTGITGNAAAWLLHKDHDITVYERHPRIGGHANTMQMGNHPPVDIAFMAYNETGYPNLLELFDRLGVETEKTDFSFSTSLKNGDLEYAGRDVLQQRNIQKDVKRFREHAAEYLTSKEPNMPIGMYLKKNGYSLAFMQNYLFPLAATIWHIGIGEIGKFPARSFIHFFKNQGLFLPEEEQSWHSIIGGSKNYVAKLTEPFKENLRPDKEAVSIYRRPTCVEITDKIGQIHSHDQVILACHADQSIRLLQDVTEREKEILGGIPYAFSTAFLHQDEKFMPVSKKIWAARNYLHSTKEGRVCMTYWLNKIHPSLNTKENYFLTLNPPAPPEKTIQKTSYNHPHYTREALKTWRTLRQIQGVNKTWFCGAWCGYGNHEDGLSAGLAVAESIGPSIRPWSAGTASPAGSYASTE